MDGVDTAKATAPKQAERSRRSGRARTAPRTPSEARPNMLPRRATRRTLRNQLRSRASAGVAALRPLGRHPEQPLPRGVPRARHRGRGDRADRDRDPLVPGSDVRRAHVHPGDGPHLGRLRAVRVRVVHRDLWGSERFPGAGGLHLGARREQPRMEARPERRRDRRLARRAGQDRRHDGGVGSGDDSRRPPGHGRARWPGRRPMRVARGALHADRARQLPLGLSRDQALGQAQQRARERVPVRRRRRRGRGRERDEDDDAEE